MYFEILYFLSHARALKNYLEDLLYISGIYIFHKFLGALVSFRFTTRLVRNAYLIPLIQLLF